MSERSNPARWEAPEPEWRGSRKLSPALLLACLALTFSGAQGFLGNPGELVRVIPVVQFCFAALVGFIAAPVARRRFIGASVVYIWFLCFLLLVGVMPTVSSFYGSERATMYGSLMVVVLICARALLSEIGLYGVLRALYFALAIIIPVVVAATLPEFIAALSSGRYSPFGFHPNAIAGMAALVVPMHVWLGPRRKAWRLVCLALAGLCLAVILATGSRGGVIAVVLALLLGTTLSGLGKGGVRMSWAKWLTILIVVLAMLVALIVLPGTNSYERATNYLTKKMALDSADRGINSGMSGRTKIWTSFLPVLLENLTLFGHGYRTTGEDVAGAVDNGYLTNTYELGVIPVCLIVGCYLFNLVRVIRLLFRDGTRGKSCLLTYACLIFLILASSVIGRGLFSYGDPLSIVALCLLVSADFDYREFRGVADETVQVPDLPRLENPATSL
jgi:O-antigen ligase